MGEHGEDPPVHLRLGRQIELREDVAHVGLDRLLGVGTLAFAWVGLGDRRAPMGWGWLSLAVGVVTLLLSGAYAANEGNLVDLLLVTDGLVLFPA
jgi:hypothetical protein